MTPPEISRRILKLIVKQSRFCKHHIGAALVFEIETTYYPEKELIQKFFQLQHLKWTRPNELPRRWTFLYNTQHEKRSVQLDVAVNCKR